MALFKNKETDKKRKGENVIGKIIYGFLLFAPLMSILFTSLYTVFNKNAYESYYGETINESEMIPYNYEQLRVNEQYTFIANSNDTFEGTLSIFGTIIEYKVRNGDYVQIEGYTSLNFFNSNEFYFRGQGLTAIYRTFSNTEEIKFTFTSYSENNFTGLENKFYKQEYNKYSFLDNAFEYGMYKTEQSNIYNWSKSTGTYTVLQNVCTGIGITNTFVPMLMAYWLLISIIYFLFDIALILIWAVHDKIHALKDAI